jgi:hypothetical protein
MPGLTSRCLHKCRFISQFDWDISSWSENIQNAFVARTRLAPSDDCLDAVQATTATESKSEAN